MRACAVVISSLFLVAASIPAAADDRLPEIPSFRLASPAASPAPGPAPARGGGGGGATGGGHWFVGGGLGLSFGTVDFIEILPVVGYRFGAPFSLGIQFVYRYRNDSRYGESVSTTDYGATLFFRYFIVPNFFLEADYEYLSFEFITPTLDAEREKEGNVFAGAGFSQSLGGKSSFSVSVLYNLTFDDNSPSAYSDPWVIRIGATFGF